MTLLFVLLPLISLLLLAFFAGYLPYRSNSYHSLSTSPLNPVEHALLSARDDDEPSEEDDCDGGLAEARREGAERDSISTEELRREIGLPSSSQQRQ